MATYPVVSRGIGRKPPSSIRIEGDVAIISLTFGLETTVDAADVESLAGYRWVALINSTTGHAYAARYEKSKCILLHRMLLAAPASMQVDHIDGDGLSNRRSNIRLATRSQNQANRVAERRNKLKLKGVYDLSKKSASRPFGACVHKDGRSIHLGTYVTAEEASAAYRGAAKALFGSFARVD